MMPAMFTQQTPDDSAATKPPGLGVPGPQGEGFDNMHANSFVRVMEWLILGEPTATSIVPERRRPASVGGSAAVNECTFHLNQLEEAR